MGKMGKMGEIGISFGRALQKRWRSQLPTHSALVFGFAESAAPQHSISKLSSVCGLIADLASPNLLRLNIA